MTFQENIVEIISSPFELLSFGKYNHWGRPNSKCSAVGSARGSLKEYLKLVNPWHRSLRHFNRLTLYSGYTIVNVGSENIDTRLYLDVNISRDEIRTRYYKK